MILSQYRNPPYRMPMLRGEVASPPPGQSPKRKRLEPAAPPNPLRLQAPPDGELRSRTGADSPRSKVAERFQNLTIDQPQSPRSPSPRKRLKWSTQLEHDSGRLEDTTALSSRPALSNAQVATTEPSYAPETIDSPASRPSSPDVEQSHTWTVEREAEEPTAMSTLERSGRSKDSQRPGRISSPPPPAPAPAPIPVDTGSCHSSNPAASNSSTDSSPDRTALTWQDNEITGHDIDITTGDDDGEGINGIGFKPTAAIAYARSQRRKQQVSEWRAREAREARQRRFERRRGSAVSERRSDPIVRRVVRFEGVI